MPSKIDEILAVAETYDIPVIEDSAEALGSSINGRKCGTYGKLSVLSFNGNKIITTSGGGALLGDEEDVIAKSRFLATQARDDAPHYQHSEVGYNYRMSNIVAGIGRGQMKVLDGHVAKRRAVHQFYFDNLGRTWLSDKSNSGSKDQESPTGIYFLKEPDGFISNRWLSTVIVNPEETGGITREDIRIALEEENIECRPLWKPMHMQPLYENAPYYGNGVCEMLFEYGLCLPSGSNMTDGEREKVLYYLKKVLRVDD
jgi:dTDP-4-amino-4,6-dideoxygalactose transaminase